MEKVDRIRGGKDADGITLGNIPLGAASANGNGASSSKAGLRAPPRLNIPKAKVGQSELDAAMERLMASKNQASSIGEWMLRTGFPKCAEIDRNVERAGEDYLDEDISVNDTVDGEEVTLLMKIRELRKRFRDDIDSYLKWEEDGTNSQRRIRRAAHAAKIMFDLSQVKSLQDLHELLLKFFNRGYSEEADESLIKSPRGEELTFRGPKGKLHTFAVDERYGDLGKDEVLVENVCKTISDLDSRFKIKLAQEAKDVEKELRNQSQTSVTNLCEGKAVGNGLCALKILPWGNCRDEGTIQVRLDEDGRVWPMAASGKMQDAIAQFRSDKVYVTLEQLFNEDGKLRDENDVPYFRLKEKLQEEKFRRWVGIRVKFWHWVRLGIHLGLKRIEKEARLNRQQEERNALLQKMAEDLGDEGTINPKDWLLKKQPGDAVLIKEDWEGNGNSLEFLPAKVRREIEGETSFISFLGTLPVAGDRFVNCVGKRWEEKDRFEGIDDPLGRFLRAMWSQVRKARR